MSNSTKKGFGVYATLVSAVLAIAAAAWCPARWWG